MLTLSHMNGMTAVLEVLQEQCVDPAPPEAAAWLPLALQMSLRRIVRKCEGVLLRQYKLVQDLNDLASMQHMHSDLPDLSCYYQTLFGLLMLVWCPGLS